MRLQYVYKNSHKKSFDLTKNRHIRKFDELFSKNKVTRSATNMTDKEKLVINMSSRQLFYIKTDFLAISVNSSEFLLTHCLIKIS